MLSINYPMDQNDQPPQPHKSLEGPLEELQQQAQRLRKELQSVIVGQSEMIDLLLTALLAGGHVLLEGVPGIAKTLAAKLLARTIQANFSRIQFTPDLMPSDVLGTTVFNMKEGAFQFKSGPIFANVILIDEINRAPAKTQAALFEVMEENQVTVDGATYSMGFPFLIIATQNPVEQEGTYQLPEAQLDRFLMRIKLGYPSLSEEQQILRRFRSDFKAVDDQLVRTILSPEQLQQFQLLVEQVFIRDELLDYIAAIVHRSRTHPDLFLGASPRASLAMLRCAKATAALAGRPFVTPEDIRAVAVSVLNHRLILRPEREMEGRLTENVIAALLTEIELPR